MLLLGRGDAMECKECGCEEWAAIDCREYCSCHRLTEKEFKDEMIGAGWIEPIVIEACKQDMEDAITEGL